ncbi:hypothetical protein [Kaistella carnis]|uniref:hypothetical protein n=1 Tax=Kaistella carnis TaxID=1241979 RepID=UPI0028ACC6D9|nr:hypothetical protein [Kaistella carnis]
MKKFIFIGAILTASFSFAQVQVTTKHSENLDKVYKGGNEKFEKDVQDNLRMLSADYQVNGKFVLTFGLNEKGEIINTDVTPNISDAFSTELIRSFKRVKKNFSPDHATENLAVLLDFNPSFKNEDGRERFTESTATARFNNR